MDDPKQAPAPTNAREHPRVPLELKVEYRRLNSFFADYTKNISKGGTFIKTPNPLPLGTRLAFRLTVPARAEPFELQGEVTWTSAEGAEPGMGIKFLHADDGQRAAFQAAVEQLMSDSLGAGVAGELLKKGTNT